MKHLLLLLLAPMLFGMTCNPNPQALIVPAEQCVRAMQEFAKSNQETKKQMAAVASIIGRSSMREDEQTKVLKQLVKEMQNWNCALVTPLPKDLTINGG